VTTVVPQRILLIKPSSLGDIVHALPVLALLRDAYPRAHIAWLAGLSFAPLLEAHPLLDEVIPFDRARFGRMLRSPAICGEFLAFVRGIRARRFDLVIDLQGLLRSAYLAWTSGAARRVGFAHARELAPLFYTHRVRVPQTARHAVDQNLHIAAALGLPTNSAPRFPLGLRPEERQAAAETLATLLPPGDRTFIAVLIGARWDTKLWRAERIANLIDRLHARGYPRCILLGGPGDAPLAADVRAAGRSEIADLVGRTSLRQLAALLERAALVVTLDSGPMHIAAALERPIVALFGPTDPARCGPHASQTRIAATPIACAPCYQRRCWHHSCMNWLQVDDVLQHVVSLAQEAGVHPIVIPDRHPRAAGVS
jgi:lipopolysaccharide heptosyltransferase I